MTTASEAKVWIPDVPDERIRELAEKIKPVVTFPRKGRRYIKPVDLFETAFTWSPKPADEAAGLTPLCEIKTYHSYGAPVFFKPSVAEVLAQIPEELLGKVVAFEIIESPECADDLNREREATNAGFHVAKTRLYAKE